MDEVIKIDGVQVTTGSDGMFTIDGYSGKHVFSIIASSYDDYFVIFRPSSVQGRYICYAYNASFGKQANKVFNVNIFYVDD